MRVADFQYDLPKYLIAQEPIPNRTDSRLLVLDGATGALQDRHFADLPEMLNPGDLLVFNDTRVLKARLFGRRPTGGRVEILIERVIGGHRALAHLNPARVQKAGAEIHLEDGLIFKVLNRRPDDLFEIQLESDLSVHELMERYGQVPLPPYIDRKAGDLDLERYQTVYGRLPGAVAAPTAGLHFDTPMLEALAARGVEFAYVTLHVGAGTFQPVRAEYIEDHQMHEEYVEVSAETCEEIRAARARGGRVIAVGTTSVRALETAAAGGELEPIETETDLFITPGFRFRVVDAMLTNFHLPESTLLMLVCAFAGRDQVLEAYHHAVRQRYRFFSYGDAMLVTPASSAR